MGLRLVEFHPTVLFSIHRGSRLGSGQEFTNQDAYDAQSESSKRRIYLLHFQSHELRFFSLEYNLVEMHGSMTTCSLFPAASEGFDYQTIGVGIILHLSLRSTGRVCGGHSSHFSDVLFYLEF
jgi:hypothetical protein